MDALRDRSALVLEDEYIIAMDLQDMLAEWGFASVRVAHDAEEAREALADGGADVLLADYQLAAGTSAAVIAEAQASGSAVIVLTGRDLDAAALDAIGQPAVISKPVTPEFLRKALLRAVGTG